MRSTPVRRLHLATIASLLLACSPSIPPLPPPIVPPTTPPRTGQYEAMFAGYRRVFKVKLETRPNDVVIAPGGDVVTLDFGKGQLHARDTGDVLTTFKVCGHTPLAAAFVDDKRLLIACDQHVEEVTFPGATINTVFRFPNEMRRAAIGGGRLAVTDGQTSKALGLHVYRLPGFDLVDEVDAGKLAQDLSITTDGRLVAATLAENGLIVRDTVARATLRVPHDKDVSPYPVCFSPDGSALLTRHAPGVGGEGSLATGKIGRAFALPDKWYRARYLDADRILAAGKQGLMMFSGKSDVLILPDPDLQTALGVSRDGSFFCAAGFDGTFACYSEKAAPPAPLAAPPPPPVIPPFPGPAAPPPGLSAGTPTPFRPSVSIDGTLVRRAGKSVVISSPQAASVTPGRKGELSYHVDSGFFKADIIIATVEVKRVDKDRITLAILALQSQGLKVNNKPVDFFAPKSAVILAVE